MFEGYGPASFSVKIGDRKGNVTGHQIQIVATNTPGTFTMSVGKNGNPLHAVATLTIDDDGNILTSQFTDKFADRDWSSIEGSFGLLPPGGSIVSVDSPAGTNGLWSAGGGAGEPHPHEHKRAHA
jgi:hypothetical protein